MLSLRCLLKWIELALRHRTWPTDRLFLDAVYDVYLHRKPDPEGLAAYLQVLRGGPAGYWRVMREVGTSPEFRFAGSGRPQEATEPSPPGRVSINRGDFALQAAALDFIAAHYTGGPERYSRDDEYVRAHARRFAMTLALTADFVLPQSRLLDVGASYHMLVLMWRFLQLRELRACGWSEEFVGFGHGQLRGQGDALLEMQVSVDRCNIEKERWPYESGSVDIITCSEVVEHLQEHPLFMMAEANRVLAPGGHLVITTPNSSSYRAIRQILHQGSPCLFSVYNVDRLGMEHVKEYSVSEIQHLYRASGFEVVAHATFSPYAEDPVDTDSELYALLKRHGLADDMSGSTHFIVGRKSGPPEYEYLSPIYTATKRWHGED